MNPQATGTRHIDLATPTVPIRCFVDEQLMPDGAARRQLEELAAMSGVQKYVAVLPDVHYKERNPTPSGTVVVTSDVVLPRALG